MTTLTANPITRRAILTLIAFGVIFATFIQVPAALAGAAQVDSQCSSNRLDSTISVAGAPGHTAASQFFVQKWTGSKWATVYSTSYAYTKISNTGLFKAPHNVTISASGLYRVWGHVWFKSPSTGAWYGETWVNPVLYTAWNGRDWFYLDTSYCEFV